MKKVSLKKRVMDFIKGGDEAKMNRFETKLDKYYTKQISLRKEAMTNLQDKIADAEEAIDETILNIDPESIKDTDKADAYCSVYVKAVEAKMDAVASLQDKIDNLQLEVEKLEAIQNRMYKVEEAEAPSI